MSHLNRVLIYTLLFLILKANVVQAKLKIARCCPVNMGIFRKKCIKVDNLTATMDFSDAPVYTKQNQLLNKSVKDVFEVVDASVVNNKFNFSQSRPVSTWALENDLNLYLTEEGAIYGDFVNEYTRFKPVYSSQEMCLGYRAMRNNLTFMIFAYTVDEPIDDEADNAIVFSIIKVCGFVVSCIFLILVLLVYTLIEELRNPNGVVLMSWVFNLLVWYILLATLNVLVHFGPRATFCRNMSLLIYYFILASFFWMNIMSVNLWRSFSGAKRTRPPSRRWRRGERRKYLYSCAYACGVPAVMTAAVAVLDRVDLTRWPNFIKPNVGKNNCFFQKEVSRLYLHAPMLIMLVFNTVLFILTMRNIGQDSEAMAVLKRKGGSATNKQKSAYLNQRKRCILYLKLSAVMGVNWLVEMVGTFVDEDRVMIVPDLYNALLGAIVFFVFIYKDDTLTKLLRLSGKGQSRPPTTKRIVTSTYSNCSDVTIHSNVMPHPDLN